MHDNRMKREEITGSVSELMFFRREHISKYKEIPCKRHHSIKPFIKYYEMFSLCFLDI